MGFWHQNFQPYGINLLGSARIHWRSKPLDPAQWISCVPPLIHKVLAFDKRHLFRGTWHVRVFLHLNTLQFWGIKEGLSYIGAQQFCGHSPSNTNNIYHDTSPKKRSRPPTCTNTNGYKRWYQETSSMTITTWWKTMVTDQVCVDTNGIALKILV